MSDSSSSVGGVSVEERRWEPAWPCPVAAVMAPQRHGAGDPTFRSDGPRTWRAFRTPEGPATLCVHARDEDGSVRARAWGEGAAWVLGQVPDLLGASDDVSAFVPGHPLVDEAWRRHPHLRFGRSGLVMDSLVPAVIEQKVTGQEAFAGYRALVRRLGAPAPGGDEVPAGLLLPPAADDVAGLASWEWLRLHVDPARSRTLVAAARVAPSLERLARGSGAEAERGLRSLRGIGEWTAAEVRQRSFGDADAVSFGDYHVAKDAGWALEGRPYDDDELRERLVPWAGHRARVVLLLRLHAGARPRRGPRMAPRTHLPARTPGR